MTNVAGRLAIAAGLTACVLGSGCITLQDPDEEQRAQADAMRQRNAYEQLRIEVLQMRERVGALESVREDQARQLEQLRADLIGALRFSRELRDLVGGMQQSLESLKTEQKAMRTQIVDEISRNIAQVLKEQAAKAAPPPPPVKAVTGYEHVAKKGETITKIAEAYHVSVAAILQANSLKEGDPLLVGQKLFIPAAQ
jgi:LysM repeat protein